jgi:hypothetical protein
LDFAGLVKKHQTERAAKGFDCRTQFVAILRDFQMFWREKSNGERLPELSNCYSHTGKEPMTHFPFALRTL